MADYNFTNPPEDHSLRFEYSEITPNIFIGTNLCCQVHFDEELLGKGVTADVSLEEERLDAPFGVETFLWLPTKDGTPPSDSQLVTGIATLTSLIERGKKVYVHCKHGHGRSPTLVAAYFISKGDSVEEALKKIKTRRSSMHVTPEQITALKQLEAKN